MTKKSEMKQGSKYKIRPPSMKGFKDSLKEMMDMSTGKTKKNIVR